MRAPRLMPPRLRSLVYFGIPLGLLGAFVLGCVVPKGVEWPQPEPKPTLWPRPRPDHGVAVVFSQFERDGAADARADLEAGHPRYLTWGFPPGDIEVFADLIHRRFGLTWEPTAGCVVDAETTAYADSYDRVIEAYIAQRYGFDALDKASKDAHRLWTEQKGKPYTPQLIAYH